MSTPEPHCDHREHMVKARPGMLQAGDESGGLSSLYVGEGMRREQQKKGNDKAGVIEICIRSAASSQTSHQDGCPLNRPVSAKAADNISRQSFGPARPTNLEHLERPHQRKGCEDKDQLSELDTHIEKEQRKRQFRLRHACRGKSAGKAESVQQPEQEGHDPGIADRQARLAPPRADDSGPRKRMLSAMAAFSGGSGALA